MKEGDGNVGACVGTLCGSVGRCLLQKQTVKAWWHASHPSTQEVEAGRGLSSWGSLHTHSETLSEASVTIEFGSVASKGKARQSNRNLSPQCWE